MNENYAQPAMPEGAAPDIIKGMYLFRAGEKKAKAPRVQLLGSGTIFREVIAAADLLKSDWGVESDLWSCPSFTELARDGMRVTRENLLNPTAKPKLAHAEACLEDTAGPVIAATDYMRAYADQIRACVGAPLRRARHRRLRAVGHAREAAPVLRGRPLLRDGRRAEGAGRRRCAAGGEGGRRDEEIRPRPGEAGAVDRVTVECGR